MAEAEITIKVEALPQEGRFPDFIPGDKGNIIKGMGVIKGKKVDYVPPEKKTPAAPAAPAKAPAPSGPLGAEKK